MNTMQLLKDKERMYYAIFASKKGDQFAPE
jgi:hypothetical protein